MSTLPQVKKLSHRHEAVLRWIFANPERKLRECAEELGYTQAWVSCIVHSDVFQARLSELRGQFDDGALLSLNEKVSGIAHLAADKLLDQMEHMEDPVFLRDTMDKTLSKLGYGTPKKGDTNVFMPGSQQQNNTVDKEVLEQALARRSQSISSNDGDVVEAPPSPPLEALLEELEDEDVGSETSESGEEE